MPTPREQSQRSLKIAMGEQMQSLPSDMGMLDGTFIMPVRANRPSMLSSRWKDRWKLEYARLMNWARDHFRWERQERDQDRC